MKTQFSKLKKQAQRGFTLVEIAIVLMIIGLLIGGILRGQELITSARTRNIIDQKSAIQTAIIGFQDRYRMTPGALDATQAKMVPNATSAVSGTNASHGIMGHGTAGSSLVFQNLAASGFISCGPCLTVTTVGGVEPTVSNSLTNAYGNIVHLVRAGVAGGDNGTWFWDNDTSKVVVIVTTGAGIKSDIMAEVDRKADDGKPGTGGLRLTTAGNATGGTASQCTDTLAAATTAAQIAAANWAASADWDSCSGSWLL